MEEIISWCNNNSAFIDIIFSFSSLTISVVAIIISVGNSIKQKKIQLLDMRKSSFNDAMELLDEYGLSNGIAKVLGWDKTVLLKIMERDNIVKTFNILFRKKFRKKLMKALEVGEKYKKIDNDICTYIYLLEVRKDFRVIETIKNYEIKTSDSQYCYDKEYENNFSEYCENTSIYGSPYPTLEPAKTYNYQILSKQLDEYKKDLDKLKNEFDIAVQKYLRSI